MVDGPPFYAATCLSRRNRSNHVFDVEAALARYETAMVPGGTAAAEKSARGLELCFAEDAPRGIVHFFESMGVPREH
jgi:hypothetical protein